MLKPLGNSFRYAANGIIAGLRSERNLKIHTVAAVIVIIAGLFTGLSTVEWAILFLLIGGMLSLELINTAIERVVDLAMPDRHPLAGLAKDLAAGAVFIFAIVSVMIGMLIFLPKWL